MIAEITEIETGKRADRPKLASALKLCRVHGATLIIAKLDRLARNVAFVSALMDAGVEFEAVDFPQANRLTIHIMAAVAEHEAKAISDRTKAALASAKAQGVSLGGVRKNHKPFTAKARAKGPKVIAARARERAADLAPILAELRASGISTLHGIAAALNERSIPTASSAGRWQATSVSRLLARLPTNGPSEPEQADLSEITAKITEVLADLILMAPPADQILLVSQVLANLGGMVFEKCQETDPSNPRRSRH